MTYKFDDFELDTDRFELRRSGEALAIEPQVFALIALLVANNERMVSKDEIHNQIWSGRIVSEAALSSRIRTARQILGDDGKNQRVIRTVHSSGFRFVPEVTIIQNSNTQTPEPVSNPAATEASALHSLTKPIIAVLPFDNQSGDPEQEYFSDAITSDIITALSKHRWLNVIARNTTFGYKGISVNIRQIGNELGANYVVEGTVRKADSRIRVTAQLIDVQTESHKWADKYDRELKDVFTLQDEITERIAARLEPEIGYAERQKVERSHKRDLQAWECFHLGVSHFFKFTAKDNLEAQRLLNQSRELDPNFGEASAWWAYAIILGMVYWDTEPSSELLDEALDATKNALYIDDQNAVFYALKARVQLARREYNSAIAENQLAIGLNPTFAAAHCGLADSLAYEGRYDEAIHGFEKAIELSPNDPQRWAFLTYGALALIFNKDFEKAAEWAQRARVIPNCQYWTSAHLAVALAFLDKKEESAAAVRKLLKENPQFTIEFAKRKLFYLKRPEQLALYLKGLQKAGVPKK